MRYNELGQELPDSTPLEVPAGFKRPLTLNEQIQAAVRGALSRAAERNDAETFEEANDFDVEDDDDFGLSPSEFRAMEVEVPDEAKRIFEDWRAKRKKESEPLLGAGRGKVRAEAEGEVGESEDADS